ncbi:hypothetical protein FS842_007558, partial [Serendipita sp. 407]
EVILGDEETLKVQLIAVEPQSPPLTCVLHFHSSLVMNLITYDHAYSLFPRATFIKRTGVTFGNFGRLESVTKAYNKYVMRNFKISRDPLPPSSRDPLLVYGDRWIGDCQSWTIALDTTGVTIPYWVKEANDYLGLPLLACQGFSVRNTQPRQPTVQNPAPKHYQNGDVLLTFELVCCTILRLPLVLPISDSPSRSEMWPRCTCYPATYSFMMSASYLTFSFLYFVFLTTYSRQQRFEEEKVVEAFSRRTLRPDTVPGWQFWDAEVLQYVHREYTARTGTPTICL